MNKLNRFIVLLFVGAGIAPVAHSDDYPYYDPSGSASPSPMPTDPVINVKCDNCYNYDATDTKAEFLNKIKNSPQSQCIVDMIQGIQALKTDAKYQLLVKRWMQIAKVVKNDVHSYHDLTPPELDVSITFDENIALKYDDSVAARWKNSENVFDFLQSDHSGDMIGKKANFTIRAYSHRPQIIKDSNEAESSACATNETPLVDGMVVGITGKMAVFDDFQPTATETTFNTFTIGNSEFPYDSESYRELYYDHPSIDLLYDYRACGSYLQQYIVQPIMSEMQAQIACWMRVYRINLDQMETGAEVDQALGGIDVIR